MKAKGVILMVPMILTSLVLAVSMSQAEDPTALIVVRAADDSLWKATCDGFACTSFTSFPGRFGSQPTVYWDEKIRRYVLWGRASDNTIWRSTFSAAGTFENNWVRMPGATASPVGAAGIDQLVPLFDASHGNSLDVATLAVCPNTTELATTLPMIPRVGYVLATASGIYNPGVADKYVRVCISNVAAPSGNCTGWSPVMESTAANFVGFGAEKRWALSEWFSAVTPGSHPFYLKACREDAQTTGTLLWNSFNVQFHLAVF